MDNIHVEANWMNKRKGFEICISYLKISIIVLLRQVIDLNQLLVKVSF